MIAWHERAEFLDGGNKGVEVELKKDETKTQDFTLKGK